MHQGFQKHRQVCHFAHLHDLLPVQPESACTEYSRVRGLDASALQLSGARSVINLCCEVGAGGACTSNLQPGGMYFPGEHPCALQLFARNGTVSKAVLFFHLRTGRADASISTCEPGCLMW